MKHSLYVRRKNGTIVGLTERGKAVAAAKVALNPLMQIVAPATLISSVLGSSNLYSLGTLDMESVLSECARIVNIATGRESKV